MAALAVTVGPAGRAARLAGPQFSPGVRLIVPADQQLVLGALPYGLVQGEPTIRSDSPGTLYVMAPATSPIGCELWTKAQGTATFSFHRPPDLGAGGGDCDLAIGPTAGSVAYSSLSLADLTVGASTDSGQTFSTPNPVGSTIAGDDRQWMASDGSTVYMTTHFVASDNICVLRSTDGGRTYSVAGLAIDRRTSHSRRTTTSWARLWWTWKAPPPQPIYTIFTAPSTVEANTATAPRARPT